ncbi:MAG TPA: hypothetical protein PKG88_01390 [Bacteroidales bacterium]|nr:hypothetical protein [Bacteroidales bacterium]HPS72528.1 hypothetical protein [Bacteroidales bacterium]
MKNKFKILLLTIAPFFSLSLVFVILFFLISKFIGFEDHLFTPGSSTVNHSLVTSYKEGLKYWPDFLFYFFAFFIMGLLLFSKSRYKDIIKKYKEKDLEKEKLEEIEKYNKNTINKQN